MYIHLPDQQTVYFKAGEQADAANQYEQGVRRKTELLAYFEACQIDTEAAKLRLEQMPEHYVYKDVSVKTGNKCIKAKAWVKRQAKFNVFGCVKPVHPSKQEQYALRCLIQHTVGVTGYDYLLTVNGHKCDTFVEAATMRGLLLDTREWVKCLEEAAWRLTPKQLRRLFVSILYHGQATNGPELWEKYKKFMYDSKIPHTVAGQKEHERRADWALAVIDHLLSTFGKSCTDYGLPKPTVQILQNVSAIDQFYFPREFEDDVDNEAANIAKDNYGILNIGQKSLIDELEKALCIKFGNQEFLTVQRLFFVTGDGGTGKTFLYNTSICRFRILNFKVIPTASTGAAANLLLSGTTAHSVFRLSINVEAGITPPIPHESFFGRRIREADFIIIDEVSMLNKVVIEVIEQLCREMAPTPALNSDKGTERDLRTHRFGGKVVLLGGDWKQSLPIDPTLAGQVAACFQSSVLYPYFKQVRLTENMRLEPDQVAFSAWLRDIGVGKLQAVELPPAMVTTNYQALIDHAYGDCDPLADPAKALEGLIVATRHTDVRAGNKLMQDKNPRKSMRYLSTDISKKERPLDVNQAAHEVDGLNMLNPPNFPAHELELKVGDIIMLLVNLDVSRGLCNGTRLVINDLDEHLILAEIITGTGAISGRGNVVGICRVRLDYQDLASIDGVHFDRMQYPVALADVMTIQKAQGQTVKRLGIDLTHEVFSHGQLYTAFSRVTRDSGLLVYAPNSIHNGKTIVQNIVAEGLELL